MGLDASRIPENEDDTTSVAGAPVRSPACPGCTTVFGGARRCSTKGVLSTEHSQRTSLFMPVSVLLASVSCLLVSGVMGSSAVVASCDAKHKDLVFPLREGNSAKFSCSKAIGNVYPSFESGNYCETKECTSVKSLTSVPEMQVTTSSAQDGFAIILNKAPPEQRVLYFVCSPTGSQPPFQPDDTCVVKITAEPNPKPEGPHLPEPSAQCGGGTTEILLPVTEANQSVTFSCRDGDLIPGDNEVFSTPDCREHSQLSQLIPGAKIVTDTKKPNVYTLSVGELPQAPIGKVCLKLCASTQAVTPCKVYVTVAAKADPSGSEKPDGKAPGASNQAPNNREPTPGSQGKSPDTRQATPETPSTGTTTQSTSGTGVARQASGYSVIAFLTVVLAVTPGSM